MSQKIIYFFLSILFISNAFSITIDGDLSDDEWSNAETLEGFLTVFPDTLEKPKYKTEVKYFTDNYNCSTVDGVRINFDEGWGLVRASNTQPVIVCRFEATSVEKMDEYKNLVISKLNEIGELKFDVGH